MEGNLLYYAGVAPTLKEKVVLKEKPKDMGTTEQVKFNTSFVKNERALPLVEDKLTSAPKEKKSKGPMPFEFKKKKKKRRRILFSNAEKSKTPAKEEKKEISEYESFLKSIKEIEIEKRKRYHKKRGRKRKEEVSVYKEFFLTEEIKEKIESIKESVFTPKDSEYDEKRGPLFISRQAHRAISNGDHDLLVSVFGDLKAHNPLCSRSADVQSNVLMESLKKNDVKSVELISHFIEKSQHGFYLPNQKPRVTIRSNLKSVDTGMHSMRAFNRRIRRVNLSRGSREGNNAFAADNHCYNSMHQTYPSFEHLLCTTIQQGHFVSNEMLDFLIAAEKISNVVNIFSNSVRFGDAGCAEYCLKRLIKNKGHGLTKVHLQALTCKTLEEMDHYGTSSILKRGNGVFFTPVHLACINEHTPKILEAFLDEAPEGKGLKLWGGSLMHTAAACKKPHNLEHLYNIGMDLNDMSMREETPLMLACELGRVENVRFILENEPTHINVMSQIGSTALHRACQNGHTEVVEELLKCPLIDVNVKTTNTKEAAAIIAAKNGHLDILKLLREKGNVNLKNSVDSQGKGCLVAAIKNFHLEIMKYLILECGFNPNKVDTSGNSMVHYASGYDNFDALLLLEACGCELNVVNQWKTNPLQISMLKNNWAVFDHLLESSGIDVNAKDSEGKTMVYLLLEKKDECYVDQSIHLIEEQKADVSAVSFDGTSLFHLLCRQPKENDLLVAEFLLKKGAPLSLKDKEGKTPLDDAVIHQNTPLFKFLLRENVGISETEEGKANVLHRIMDTIRLEEKKEEEIPSALGFNRKADFQDEGGMGGMGGFGMNVTTSYGGVFGCGLGGASVLGEQPLEGVGKEEKEYIVKDDFLKTFLDFAEKSEKNKKLFHSLQLEHDREGLTPLMRFLKRFYGQFKNPLIKLYEAFEKFILYFFEISKTTVEDHVVVKIEESEEDKEKRKAAESKNSAGSMFGRRAHRRRRFHPQNYQQSMNDFDKDLIGRSMLHFAVEEVNERLIDLFCGKMRADVNLKDINGVSALHIGVQKASQDYSLYRKICKKLLHYGASIIAKDAKKRSILHYMFIKKKPKQQMNKGFGYAYGGFQQQQKVNNNKSEPIELLSDLCVHDIEIDEGDVYGRTPLHYSSIQGFTICSMLLIDQGANVNQCDEDGNTPLSIGLMANHIDFSICLINKGADIKGKLMELKNVDMTYNERQRRIEKGLLKLEEESNQLGMGNNAFAYQQRFATKKKKRRSGESDEENDENKEEKKKEQISIFKFVIKKNLMGLFFLALSQGISFHEGVKDCITLQQFSLVLTILEKTKVSVIQSVNEEGENIFHFISRAKVPPHAVEEFMKVANKLINVYKVDPNCLNKKNLSPFFYSVYARNVVMMKFFIKTCQSNVNIQDENNHMITPLIHFIQMNDLSNVKYLLSHPKIDVNLKDSEGKTAIFYAVQSTKMGSYQNLNLFRKMVEVSTNFTETKDNDGKTPLFYIYLQKNRLLASKLSELAVFVPPEILSSLEKEVEEERKELMKMYYGCFETTEFEKRRIDSSIVEKDFNSMMEKLQELEKKNPIMKLEDFYKPNPVANMPKGCVVYRDPVYTNAFYDVWLIKTDVDYGTFGFNNFYKLQIIHNPLQEIFVLVNHYGRVGERGVFQITPFTKVEEVVMEFKKIFRQKTKNSFDDLFLCDEKKEFEIFDKKYRMIDRNLSHGLVRRMVEPIHLNEFPSSILGDEVQNLFKLLCDVKLMEKFLEKNKVNRKMYGLGNLSKKQLLSGLSILRNIEKVVKEIKGVRYSWSKRSEDYQKKMRKVNELNDLTSKFYSIIPSSEYRDQMIQPIQNEQELNQKITLIERLIDYENILKIMVASKNQKKMSPLDYMYRHIGAQMICLSPKDDEYHMIEQMVHQTTSSKDRGSRRRKIVNIYKVRGPVDYKRFEEEGFDKESNNMLLFHGTRTSNVLSILQNGLKVHPKHAQRTGRLFGDGIYVSDSFSKSLGYSHSFGDTGIMLVMECALGKQFNTFIPGTVPSHYLNVNTIKGVGWKGCPSSKMLIHTLEGFKIPTGIAKIRLEDLQDEIIESKTEFRDQLDRLEKEMIEGDDLISLRIEDQSNNAWNRKERNFEIKISPRANIYMLKKLIKKKLNIHICCQQLECFGSALNNYEVIGMIDFIQTSSIILREIQRKMGKRRRRPRMMNQGGFGFSFGGKAQPQPNQKQEEEEDLEYKSPILNYNEYTIYDEKRVRVRYMIHFEF